MTQDMTSGAHRLIFGHPLSFLLRVVLLSFSSGIPFLLTLSTLSVWLSELGIRPSVVGFMAMSTLPYCFKFLWGVVVDRVQLPLLGKWLGPRRSWTVLSQVCLAFAVILLGATHPDQHLFLTAGLAFTVCLFAALQDVVVEAYRIEMTPKGFEGTSASATYLGFRLGMMASGAGALYLASWLSWFHVYALMACCLGIGLLTCLSSPTRPMPSLALVPNPTESQESTLWDSFLKGGQALFEAYDWRVVCAFILFYKVGDTVLNVMNTPFLLSIGFNKLEIAQVAKFFGISAMIFGGFFGGVLLNRFGMLTGLLLCSALQILSCLMFFVQSLVGHNLWILTVVIGTENFTCGLGASAFIAYISSLCRPGHIALHFAILTSVASLMRILLSALAGLAADVLSWDTFFLLASFCCIPSMLLLFQCTQHFQIQFQSNPNKPFHKAA